MEWSRELVVGGALVAIFIIGFLILSRRRDTAWGKLFMFVVVGFVICVLVYGVSVMQFGDGMEGFRIGFDLLKKGVQVARQLLGRMIA